MAHFQHDFQIKKMSKTQSPCPLAPHMTTLYLYATLCTAAATNDQYYNQYVINADHISQQFNCIKLSTAISNVGSVYRNLRCFFHFYRLHQSLNTREHTGEPWDWNAFHYRGCNRYLPTELTVSFIRDKILTRHSAVQTKGYRFPM